MYATKPKRNHRLASEGIHKIELKGPQVADPSSRPMPGFYILYCNRLLCFHRGSDMQEISVLPLLRAGFNRVSRGLKC